MTRRVPDAVLLAGLLAVAFASYLWMLQWADLRDGGPALSWGIPDLTRQDRLAEGFLNPTDSPRTFAWEWFVLGAGWGAVLGAIVPVRLGRWWWRAAPWLFGVLHVIGFLANVSPCSTDSDEGGGSCASLVGGGQDTGMLATFVMATLLCAGIATARAAARTQRVLVDA